VRLFGARKMWLHLRALGHDVARCTVERLMAQMGISGVVRGKTPRTTIADESANRPPDRVDRRFVASAPNRLWVADFTYVATWTGMVYVAFVIDVFSRRVVGWRAATTMTTPLVLDALEMALWTRRKDGVIDLTGLVHHNDAGSHLDRVHPAPHRRRRRRLGRVRRRCLRQRPGRVPHGRLQVRTDPLLRPLEGP
jgi:putative transposase